MTPDGFRGAAFLQAPGSTNDHDLGLFEVGAGPARPAPGGATVGPLPPGLGGRHARRARADCAGRLAEAGALVGSSDHGTTKSLYGKDPDGLEFEVVWLIPADLLDEAALARPQAHRAAGPGREKQRYGAQTRGGVGISVPVST